MLCWPATAAWYQTTTSCGQEVNGASAYRIRRPTRTAVTIGPGRNLRSRLGPRKAIPFPPASAAVPDPGRRWPLVSQDDPPINEEPYCAHLVRRDSHQCVRVPGGAGFHRNGRRRARDVHAHVLRPLVVEARTRRQHGRRSNEEWCPGRRWNRARLT